MAVATVAHEASASTARRRPSPPASELLLSRLAEGDENALRELFDRHGTLAYRLAFRITRSHVLAEEAVQEAFLELWRRPKRFDPRRAAAGTWITVLVHRRAVDAVRREGRCARVPDDLGAPVASEGSDDAALLLLERRRVRAALARLPGEERTLLELAYYGGLTQTQLAEHLKLPLGTVKSRTSAALSRLRAALELNRPATAS